MLGVLLGTGLQLQQRELFAPLVYWVILLLAPVAYALAAIRNVAAWLRGGLVLLALALLAFGATGLRAGAYLTHALDPALEGRDVWVDGVVASLPQRNDSGVRFRLAVETATHQSQSVRIPPLIEVAWYGGALAAGPGVLGDVDTRASGDVVVPVTALNRLPAEVKAGERWQMLLRLKAPHGSRNPHGFDYELWLWEQGVQATGYVRAGAKDTPPKRVEQTWAYSLALTRQTVREWIYQRLPDRQTSGVIAALVVGDQSAIERSDWDVFRATGVAHLVSISGLHITMFAWAASGVIGVFWRRSCRLCHLLPTPHAALLGGVVLATGYSLFSGWGIPAQRTCWMLAAVACLRVVGARWPWTVVWTLACAVVVAADPWAMLQAGFWLSFVAVGILFATDLGVLDARSAGASRLKHYVLSGLREQWVITVALTPITLLLFGQVSLVGLLANVLAVPWITLLVTPLAMAGVVFAPSWDLAAAALSALLVYLEWLAVWPWASVQLAVPPWWLALAALLGGGALVLPWPWSMRLLGIPLVLPIALWRPASAPLGEFELLAADIGQGNAVLVRTQNHALLYDAGPRYSLDSDAGHRVLVPLLQALDVRLDMLMLSHRDMDHVGGAPAILAKQRQAVVLSSLEPGSVRLGGAITQPCLAGAHWDWDGVRFDILHPHAQDYAVAQKSNAMSCVLRISNGARSALLAGDIEQAQEARLVSDLGGGVKSDVLLVPHHGSKTSSSAAFLDAVQAQVAVVQSGYRNRFRHPTEPVLQRLHARGMEVVNSPQCGAWTWQSWGHQNGVCWRHVTQRYWHHHVP